MLKFLLAVAMLLAMPEMGLAKKDKNGNNIAKTSVADSQAEIAKMLDKGLKALDKARNAGNSAEKMLAFLANYVANDAKTKGTFVLLQQPNGVYGQEFMDAGNARVDTFLVTIIATSGSTENDDLDDNATTGVYITRSRLETGA